MFNKFTVIVLSIALVGWFPMFSTGCRPKPADGQALRVLAVETFLADIAQNVAGDRLAVEALMPLGADPHSFEPTPQDVARVAKSDILIVNGAGFEEFLAPLLKNAGGNRMLIEAAAGLEQRNPDPGEGVSGGDAHEGDPHFWLNPLNGIRYVENIRDGLSQADPGGKEIYARNAQAYMAQLQALDAWISDQVAQIPANRRLLVTNHESFGYFADRYGLRIIGAIIPSVSTSASPSAQQLAALIDQIKATGAPAVFLETGSNPQLAQQIAAETGIQVVTDLYTHSVSAADGPAPTYLELMRYNTKQIVEALK
jgi:ABC-type Zn uptake system ZnuABC Zn-binding protein ZnuA